MASSAMGMIGINGGGESLLTAFVGGLQASLTVLLVIIYGVIATQYQILGEKSARDISKLCVKMFLPALLLANVGQQVTLQNAWQYVPILIWSFIYTLSSMALGWAITKWLKYPAWFTPALAFNNTTSLPLVLIQSLDSTGILASLLKDENDSTKEAIARAKSFFLVCSLVCNALTFSLGPKLLDGEEAPESKEGDGDDDAAKQNDYPSARPAGQDDAAERGQGGDGPDDAEDATEQTSLLPHVVNHHINRASDVGRRQSSKVWERLPRWLQQLLEFLHNFLVAPVIGAIFGCLIGLSPPLRRIFFNSTNDGGVLTAWFTNSIKNVGDLFAALQLVVVGCKLSTSLRRMKEDKDSGTVAWGPMLTAFAVRFLLWPVISIPVIWAVATKTSLLGNDPMLWFCLMLMPTGPPAIKLTALADVNGSSEHEKMSIAKFLTISYCVSPIICLAVAGALQATQAAM